jgi:hypothetical protein
VFVSPFSFCIRFIISYFLAGGQSRAGYYLTQLDYLTDDAELTVQENTVGNGFAAFFFFCAFAIMMGAAFHISPFVNG